MIGVSVADEHQIEFASSPAYTLAGVCTTPPNPIEQQQNRQQHSKKIKKRKCSLIRDS